MIVEQNENQPQTMALRPKLVRSEMRGARIRRGTLRQRPARLPLGRCKLHTSASMGRTQDGVARLTEGKIKHEKFSKEKHAEVSHRAEPGTADAWRTGGDLSMANNNLKKCVF